MSNTIITLEYSQIWDEYETEKAYCLTFGDDLAKIYLPKSQVEDIRESVNEIDIPLWLVEAKGLEEFMSRREK